MEQNHLAIPYNKQPLPTNQRPTIRLQQKRQTNLQPPTQTATTTNSGHSRYAAYAAKPQKPKLWVIPKLANETATSNTSRHSRRHTMTRNPEHFHIPQLKRTYNRQTNTFTINISYETAPQSSHNAPKKSQKHSDSAQTKHGNSPSTTTSTSTSAQPTSSSSQATAEAEKAHCSKPSKPT